MEQTYQFLQKGSEQQYKLLIRNYLSLGQFELARACITEYHNIAPEQCLALLKSFITSDPPGAQWYLFLLFGYSLTNFFMLFNLCIS